MAGTGVGRELVVIGLRTAIARGDMSPGHRLVEADLVEMFGVSRNSVRLALDTLAAEGLVQRLANRGASVRTVSPAEAVAITECRMALESLIARKAAERITEEESAALREHAQRMRQAVEDGELATYSTLIEHLHDLVHRAGRQPVAEHLVDRLQAQIVRHQFRLSLRPGRAQVSLAELLALVDAITGRDPAAAEEAARSHFRSVVAALREPS